MGVRHDEGDAKDRARQKVDEATRNAGNPSDQQRGQQESSPGDRLREHMREDQERLNDDERWGA
ncbi:hypothetical protein V1J52_15010 [Streptomyces sp. TRM 70351]|uniref:hypothetical protein n=1 Tax=Streptomyces sp. TRM 70351 TaxID=3116552 RepID=UPI002E7BC987|nr:hypothetical protein [Streptomyces sp. TRM 70351]MEE1929477.1 hypothetical protein [Streptomyces sp. TRM 70351]